MTLYRRIDLPSDEPVQFVGVHALVWGRTGGAKVGFVEAEDVLNDTRELLAQCVRDRAALRAALKEALDALRAAPKPQSRYLGLTEALIAWRENYDLWYEGQRQAALGLAADDEQKGEGK